MIQLRICIDVADVPAAVDFYGRALGLTIGRRRGTAWAEMLGAAAPIDLLAAAPDSQPTAKAGSVRDYDRHWTPVHLDVEVTDLEQAVERARRAGAVIEHDIETKPWGRIAVLADPFGHGLCLIEMRGRGYDEIADSPAS